LLLQSENFGTTWTTTGLLAFGSGSTLNATVAPDGQTTADLLTENSSTSEHRVETANISWVANTTYTLTIFAKANGRTRMDIFGVGGGNFTGGRNASFNLSTGAVITTDGAVASIEARANAWYRIRMTFTASAAPSASQLFIRFLDNSSNFSYTGDGTSGIFLWGAQLEAGACPTSYIPTTTATVTRAVDVASITGSNFSSFYNQTEGTLFVAYDQPVVGCSIAVIDDGTANNSIVLFSLSTANQRVSSNMLVASANQGRLDAGGTFTANVLNRAALAVSASGRGLSCNGSAVSTSANPSSMPSLSRLAIQGDNNFVAQKGGHIRRLTYWPTRLANTTLQAITTS
jgi:hypothetical protein